MDGERPVAEFERRLLEALNGASEQADSGLSSRLAAAIGGRSPRDLERVETISMVRRASLTLMALLTVLVPVAVSVRTGGAAIVDPPLTATADEELLAFGYSSEESVLLTILGAEVEP
jgi:hypothetical protein